MLLKGVALGGCSHRRTPEGIGCAGGRAEEVRAAAVGRPRARWGRRGLAAQLRIGRTSAPQVAVTVTICRLRRV